MRWLTGVVIAAALVDTAGAASGSAATPENIQQQILDLLTKWHAEAPIGSDPVLRDIQKKLIDANAAIVELKASIDLLNANAQMRPALPLHFGPPGKGLSCSSPESCDEAVSAFCADVGYLNGKSSNNEVDGKGALDGVCFDYVIPKP